jgi:hypothetical protein
METPIIAMLQFCLTAGFGWKACVVCFKSKLFGSSTFKFRYNTAPPQGKSFCL